MWWWSFYQWNISKSVIVQKWTKKELNFGWRLIENGSRNDEPSTNQLPFIRKWFKKRGRYFESQRFFHQTHYDYRGRNCEINVFFQMTVTTSNETKEKDKEKILEPSNDFVLFQKDARSEWKKKEKNIFVFTKQWTKLPKCLAFNKMKWSWYVAQLGIEPGTFRSTAPRSKHSWLFSHWQKRREKNLYRFENAFSRFEKNFVAKTKQWTKLPKFL